MIQMILLPRRLIHQDKIPDFVSFVQCQTGRVQAFENQLGVVVPVQSNANNFQSSHGAIEIIYRNFLLEQHITEKLVVMGQIRGKVKVLFLTKKPFEGAAVPFQQPHLELLLVMGILGQQITILNFIAEVRVTGCNLVLHQKIADG